MKLQAESVGILTGYLFVGAAMTTVWLIWKRATR